MVAILGGLGAAVAWAAGTLCAARLTRMLGPASVLGSVAFAGLCLVLPWAVLEGIPEELDAVSAAWLAVAGFGNVVGLLLAYSALGRGKVGIVAPIVSTEGAIAAVISIAAGEPVAEGVALLLAVIAFGIMLAASTGPSVDGLTRRESRRLALFAVGAAVAFGWSLYATGEASDELPIAWAVLPPRLAGVLVVTLPLVVRSRLRFEREALPLVLLAGAAEVIGFSSFAAGARHGLAISAVLASQFAALSAIGAYFLFRERLTRVQLAGVATVIAGVATLSILQA